MFADGDPERFAQLFDVVSRYAERQQNILAGKATPSAPATPQVLPASPSTGSRVSWEEELQILPSFFGARDTVKNFWSQDICWKGAFGMLWDKNSEFWSFLKVF